MTLPRRAFLASLLAAPFVPKFSLPKASAIPTFTLPDDSPIGQSYVFFMPGRGTVCNFKTAVGWRTTTLGAISVGIDNLTER